MSSDVAWAAGFYDGEGSSWVQSSKGRLYARMSVTQKSPDTLRRWADSIGVKGALNSQGKPNGVHSLTLCRTEEIQKAIDQMWPWLTPEKRTQFVRVVERVEEEMSSRPLRRTVPLVVPHHNVQ